MLLQPSAEPMALAEKLTAHMQGKLDAEAARQAEIDAKIDNLEVEHLRKAHGLFEKYKADHEKDFNGYEFSALRYGDYLSLFIQRDGKKVVHGVNIRDTKVIDLELGRAPDRDGIVSYILQCRWVDAWSDVNGQSHHEGRREVREVYVNPPTKEFHFATFVVWGPNSDNGCGSSFEHSQRVIEGYPRDARDDRLVFREVGTLFCPAGHGEAVYKQIMAVIRDGQK